MARFGTGRQQLSRKDKVHQAWIAEARRAGNGRFRDASAGRGRANGRMLVYLISLGLVLGWYGPDWMARFNQARTGMAAVEKQPTAVMADSLSADFGYCHSGGGTNCVVDGDTFWFRGEKYRISDIDTPETHGPRCAAEGELGAQATRRLQALMNDGPFSLAVEGRDTDRYGRALRVVTREGQSIGEQLVAEGLARRWDGRRHPWC